MTLKKRSTFTELKRDSVITAALYSRQTDGINGGHKSGNSLERGSAVHTLTFKGRRKKKLKLRIIMFMILII